METLLLNILADYSSWLNYVSNLNTFADYVAWVRRIRGHANVFGSALVIFSHSSELAWTSALMRTEFYTLISLFSSEQHYIVIKPENEFF